MRNRRTLFCASLLLGAPTCAVVHGGPKGPDMIKEGCSTAVDCKEVLEATIYDIGYYNCPAKGHGSSSHYCRDEEITERHLARAMALYWNASHPKFPIEKQEPCAVLDECVHVCTHSELDLQCVWPYNDSAYCEAPIDQFCGVICQWGLPRTGGCE